MSFVLGAFPCGMFGLYPMIITLLILNILHRAIPSLKLKIKYISVEDKVKSNGLSW